MPIGAILCTKNGIIFFRLVDTAEKKHRLACDPGPCAGKIYRLVQGSSREVEMAGLSLVVGRCCRIEIGRQFDAGTFVRLVSVLEDM